MAVMRLREKTCIILCGLHELSHPIHVHVQFHPTRSRYLDTLDLRRHSSVSDLGDSRCCWRSPRAHLSPGGWRRTRSPQRGLLFDRQRLDDASALFIIGRLDRRCTLRIQAVESLSSATWKGRHPAFSHGMCRCIACVNESIFHRHVTFGWLRGGRGSKSIIE